MAVQIYPILARANPYLTPQQNREKKFYLSIRIGLLNFSGMRDNLLPPNLLKLSEIDNFAGLIDRGFESVNRDAFYSAGETEIVRLAYRKRCRKLGVISASLEAILQVDLHLKVR